MKISSKSDVITNSSSEVFTVIHKDDIKRIKLVINTILTLGGSSKTCDDLFDISYSWDYKELEGLYHDVTGSDGQEHPTHEELERFAWIRIGLTKDDSEGGELYVVLPTIKITSKHGIDLPNEFEYFTEMFAEHTEYYC